MLPALWDSRCATNETARKKYTAAAKGVDSAPQYASTKALELVKSAAFAKFDETVEVAVRLGASILGTPIKSFVEQLSYPQGLGKRFACL